MNVLIYLEQDVDDEDIEHIFQRVDDTVKHSLQFGNTLDRLQRPQHAEHSQRLDGAKILSGGASTENKHVKNIYTNSKIVTELT